MNVDEIRFDERGLAPAIVQDADSGEVLMLAYMDREAVDATMASGEVHFHSRSRDVLWRKGESSGHTLQLVGLTADCDADALLVLARSAGSTCHTGAVSCFHRPFMQAERPEGISLAPLFAVLHRRRAERPSGSYSVALFDDTDRALKKVIEEAGEVVLAVKNGDRENLAWELADLLYHLAVIMVAHDLPPGAVNDELKRRAAKGSQ